jgi:proton-dependent oligopeptide transporter, POT family
LPTGARLIVGVEFWERFSFFGMLSILTLFLTAPTTAGGFGWSRVDALSLMGIYSGVMFGLQVVGGFLADRFWGYRRAVGMGTALMTFGHFAMTGPVLLPWLLGQSNGMDLIGPLHALGIPLGSLSITPAVRAAIDGLPNGGLLESAYLMASWSFAVALGSLMLGSTLMKSSLSVLLGDQFAKDDPLREKAYAYYYVSISVAALLSGLVVGWAAEHFGWHVGFTIAGFGMAAAFILFIVSARRHLADHSDRSLAKATQTTTDSADVHAGLRLSIVALLALFPCVYAIGWFQIYGTWTLFVDEQVNRVLFGYTVPTPWIISFNALVVIIATPLVARAWVRLGDEGRNPDILQKYAAALALGACGQGVFALAASFSGIGPLLPMLGILLVSFGEVVAWVSTYTVIYQAAPPRHVAVTMGAFFAFTLGLSGFLAGRTGPLIELWGYSSTFALLAALMALFALLALAVRPSAKARAARAGMRL